jgi:hypothetical protein
MLARHHYVPLSLPELTAERLMYDPEKRDPGLGVESLKARLVISIAPQREYTEHECDIIEEYLARGGRFIITIGADDAAPARRLLERFSMNVGSHASEVAYGIAAHEMRTAKGEDGQTRQMLITDSLAPLVDQQPRDDTPLGHFKVPFATMEDNLGVYQPFVRFHAGWPVETNDPKALIISRFGAQVGEDGKILRMGVPLIIVKRHYLGLIALVGDTGFAMNKNLEREDGQPIEGMRENAFFWRWFLDLLEHEEETWRVPRTEQPPEPRDPISEMMPLLEIPPLKKNAAPAGDDKSDSRPTGEQEPAEGKEAPTGTEESPGESAGPLLQKPDTEPPRAAKEGG